jgi:ADP-ribose pyrophosphatase YjhB (NUDIX family)
MTDPWLRWAQRLQAIAQNGLTFAVNDFDRERYTQIQDIAAEMLSAGSGLPTETVRDLYNAQAGYATPKVDVRGVVFQAERILLVREKLDGGRWTLPGGWADVGDAPGEAAEREVLEEAGYQVRARKLLAFYDRDRQGHTPFIFHIYKAFFLCELLDTTQNLSPNVETEEAAWFSEPELPALDLSIGRVTLKQLQRFFEHLHHPDWPTDFD